MLLDPAILEDLQRRLLRVRTPDRELECRVDLVFSMRWGELTPAEYEPSLGGLMLASRMTDCDFIADEFQIPNYLKASGIAHCIFLVELHQADCIWNINKTPLRASAHVQAARFSPPRIAFKAPLPGAALLACLAQSFLLPKADTPLEVQVDDED